MSEESAAKSVDGAFEGDLDLDVGLDLGEFVPGVALAGVQDLAHGPSLGRVVQRLGDRGPPTEVAGPGHDGHVLGTALVGLGHDGEAPGGELPGDEAFPEERAVARDGDARGFAPREDFVGEGDGLADPGAELGLDEAEDGVDGVDGLGGGSKGARGLSDAGRRRADEAEGGIAEDGGVDVGLRADEVVAVEEGLHRPEGQVRAHGPVDVDGVGLGGEAAVAVADEERRGGEDAGDGAARSGRRPDDDVGCGQIVEEPRRRSSFDAADAARGVVLADRDVEDLPRAVEGFLKGQVAADVGPDDLGEVVAAH
mmetsp:Transcript_5612/g.14436  ORF Transcript_5612/g.14436 Transcript_5612/m.14436 type:complete len:311 (+) Transcript_5612:545-1477(+)